MKPGTIILPQHSRFKHASTSELRNQCQNPDCQFGFIKGEKPALTLINHASGMKLLYCSWLCLRDDIRTNDEKD